jgi:mannose-6-phosphate isomerase-like protein (cupin superfamily)
MLEPVVVSLADRTVVDRADTPIAMTLARTLTNAEHGSNIMAGVSWMAPGEISNGWSTQDSPSEEGLHHLGPVHEFFYLVRGRCLVRWDKGELAFNANDTIFFAPGWTYSIENIGTEEAFLVYACTPPLG